MSGVAVIKIKREIQKLKSCLPTPFVREDTFHNFSKILCSPPTTTGEPDDMNVLRGAWCMCMVC